MDTRTCKKCGVEKDLVEFPNKRSHNGKRYRLHTCVACYRPERREAGLRYKKRHGARFNEMARFRTLKWSYGITREQYEQMLQEQNEKCAICERHCSESLWGYLCVDHDHNTLKIRGLLCNLCNSALGQLKESPVILSNALKYLKEKG